MSEPSFLTVILSLIFVLALMGALLFVLKKLGITSPVSATLTGPRRLSVIEILPLSPQHRAVLIRRDTAEHLVILGPQGVTTVEQGIKHNEPV